MRLMTVFVTVLLVAALPSCGSSPKKKAQNKEMQTKSDARVKLTKEYQDCIVKAGGDKAKAKECDSYLEAIQKLKY